MPRASEIDQLIYTDLHKLGTFKTHPIENDYPPPENERIPPPQTGTIWKGNESSSNHDFCSDMFVFLRGRVSLK